MPFDGFPQETVAFLGGIAAHNEKSWFEAHRADYEAYYVAPAREFVVAAGERLRTIAPEVRADPRVLGSIARINRDTRFSPDKRPYKDHLDIGFAAGDRKSAASALFFRVTPAYANAGLGTPAFEKSRLAAFRDAVADPLRGQALLDALHALEAAGLPVQGETLKRPPVGYDGIAPERERLLRFTALWSVQEQPIGGWLHVPEALDRVIDIWQRMLPLHRWLIQTFG